MNVDLSRSVKQAMSNTGIDSMEASLGAYMQLMDAPDNLKGEDNTVKVDVEVLQNMAAFAAIALSNLICQRYKTL